MLFPKQAKWTGQVQTKFKGLANIWKLITESMQIDQGNFPGQGQFK